MMTTRDWFAALLCVLFPSLAAAQNPQWPTKPVRFITAFPVGGSSDQVARIVAERLTSIVGQQIIIDNRSGGNGVAGTALAAAAAPDGYSFLVVFDSHATNPSLQKGIPYDTVKAFTPVMLFASSPYALAVGPTAPFKSLADLIAAARAKPGELTLGSSGVGSRGHLAMALLEQRAGFRITQVPYRGPAQAMTDVIGGQITMQMGTFLFVSPFVKGQRVRALAVTSAMRMAQLPDIPTVAEQGFPGYEVRSWWGIVAPAACLRRFCKNCIRRCARRWVSPKRGTASRQLGARVHASWPADFKDYIAREMALWGKVVRDSKISATSASAPRAPPVVSDLVHLHLGACAGRQFGRRFGCGKIEFELGAHRVMEKYLVASLRDILLFEIDADFFQPRAELDRAGRPECNVVDAAAMLVGHDRACRKTPAHVDDGIVAVVQPQAVERKVGTRPDCQAKHFAVKFFDRGQIALRAAYVDVLKAANGHG